MLTPEQQQYYDKQLEMIKRGGNCTHSAYLVDCIWGKGSPNLGPVEPAVVGFSNDDDSYYVTFFKNWTEINAFINQIEEMAVAAWGPECADPLVINTNGQVAVKTKNIFAE